MRRGGNEEISRILVDAPFIHQAISVMARLDGQSLAL